MPADAPAVADLVIAYERSLYGESSYALSDVEAEWEHLDLERDAVVLLDGDRIVAFGSLHDRGELWRATGFVDQAQRGRGLGSELVTFFESIASGRGARRMQNGIVEPDDAGLRLLAGLGYRPVRVFREMSVELGGGHEPPAWPEGVVPDSFVLERDGAGLHAALQEAFADHWEYRPRTFDEWRRWHVESEVYDPTLWRVVRADGEVVAGAICEGGRYGGGWVSVLGTRRPWRGRGIGRALLLDAFAKFRERGEPKAGLGVDAENPTGAFQLYESVGMRGVMGWVLFEKTLS